MLWKVPATNTAAAASFHQSLKATSTVAFTNLMFTRCVTLQSLFFCRPGGMGAEGHKG